MMLKKMLISLLAVTVGSVAFALPTMSSLPDNDDQVDALMEQINSYAKQLETAVLPAIKGISKEVGNNTLSNLAQEQQKKVTGYQAQITNTVDSILAKETENLSDADCDQVIKDLFLAQYKQAFMNGDITSTEYEEVKVLLEKETFVKADYIELLRQQLIVSALAGFKARKMISEQEIESTVMVLFPEEDLEEATSQILEMANQIEELIILMQQMQEEQ